MAAQERVRQAVDYIYKDILSSLLRTLVIISQALCNSHTNNHSSFSNLE